MSLMFYPGEDETKKKESIDNYKDLFEPYIIKVPTLKEALEEMFTSAGLSNTEALQFISTIISDVSNFINSKFDEIKDKYKKITIDDAIIISSYTYELSNKEYNIYKILNTNLVEKNRKQGIKKI